FADADRRDPAGARRSRPPGEGPLYRLLDATGMAGRRGTMERPISRASPLRLVPGGVQPLGAPARHRDAADAAGLRSRPDPVRAARQRPLDRQVQAPYAAARWRPLELHATRRRPLLD